MFEKLTSLAALPSLNALRAFEAMARTGGATRAAAELNVTHSAVSRQVKALEAQLGLRLFEGPRHALVLTEAGRELAPELSAAFGRMAAAVARTRGAGRDLYVAANHSLAVKWLIPRLADFGHRHPEVRVHLVELAPHAVACPGADLLLRIVGADQIAALGAQPLIPNALGPVIAPSLAGDDPRAAVLTAPRLAARTHPGAWTEWAGLAGGDARRAADPAPAPAERIVAHLHFALDAALSGWGAAVVPWAVAAEAVRDGRLLAPLGFRPTPGAIAAVPGAGEATRERRLFLRWLIEQGRAMPPAPDST